MAVVRRVRKTVAVTPEEEETASPAQVKELVDAVITMIKDGALDSGMDQLESALEDRLMVQHNLNIASAIKETAKTQLASPKVTQTSKLPATPPVQKKRVATITPVAGVGYLLVSDFPKIGGAKVEFVRFRKDDANKAVIKMAEDRPGFPIGSQTIVPVAALKEAPAVKRTRATALTPKRVVRKAAK